MMTTYEWFRWLTFKIMTTHLRTVRNDLISIVKNDNRQGTLNILDVGGRKSPYTIGLDAQITVMDVPQDNAVQKDLNLGFTNSLLNFLKRKRSNIKDLLIEDMTKTTIEDNQYDAVICIEVIEHVVEDELFVENISKVIKKGGWAYFTTPNGDYIKNEGPDKNLDHIRHYTKKQLTELLAKHFDKVELRYAVHTGKHRVASLKSFNKKKPWLFLRTILASYKNFKESKGVSDQSYETAHLVVTALK